MNKSRYGTILQDFEFRKIGWRQTMYALPCLLIVISFVRCTELKSGSDIHQEASAIGKESDGGGSQWVSPSNDSDAINPISKMTADASVDASSDVVVYDVAADGEVAADDGADGESCLQEGAMRCVSAASTARQVCQEGYWVAAESCPEGTLCDRSNTEEPGSCANAAEFCQGSADQMVCFDGVMHECNTDSISVSQQECDSQRHCQIGISSETCAECIPEETYRCDGVRLEVCSEGGMAFELYDTCETAALCNAEARACTAEACLPENYICTASDILRVCNQDQTAFEDAEQCDPGLCDAQNGECDICTPGDTSCVNGKPTTCNNDGQGFNTGQCSAPRTICTGKGVCVECTVDADCGSEFCVNFECATCRVDGDCNHGECESATCNNGVCSISPTPGVSCSGGNICTSSGECVECRNNNDCLNRGDGTRVCLSAGTTSSNCVQCASPSDCPDAPACREATCSGQGICGEYLITSGSCGIGKVCNYLGVCEDACGNGRYDVGYEECDASSTYHDLYTCDDACNARTLYTECGSGSGCIAPTVCDPSGFGTDYCSPPCTDYDVSQCLEGVPVGSTVACFGGLCLIECSGDWNCPQPLYCPGPGTYCE